MSKKKLNTEGMMTELSGSPFFSPPPPQVEQEQKQDTARGEAPQRPPEDKEKSTPTKPTIQSPEKPQVTPKPATKRKKIRVPFEFFEDQISTLRKMRQEARDRDEYFSMSQIVRKAVDEYLNK